VIGFLGTVVGLSLGLLSFPDVADVDSLRLALKAFAASLSVAFNTTLLALVYAIVLILLRALLRAAEFRALEGSAEASRRLAEALARGQVQ